jgi:outer membrane protein assembly factor BamB
MRRRIALAALGLLVLAAGGLAAAWFLVVQDRPSGHVDTELKGVTVLPPKPPQPKPKPKPRPPKKTAPRKPRPRAPERIVDTPCWPNFGGDPQRSLARTEIHLGVPTKPLWARGLRSYIEYPPSYCNGTLYVNTFGGRTFAIDALSGKVIWSRQGGKKASTPAVAGPRLIVSSHDGTVTAFERATGRRLWQIQTDAKVESSPVAIGNLVYFGSTDGRLFAVDTTTGKIRWAYNTGGRINASPSVYRLRICIDTYAGSVFCLNRRTGQRLWSRYFKRDFVRYESFYASPSTDGKRLYTVSRAGKVYALDASNGDVVWTQHVNSLGYSTPAVANGRVFVGGFDGSLRAFRSTTGNLLWRRYVGGRILAPALVVGDLVFFSTLEQKTYAVRATDGRLVWQLGMGKYAPGIATDRHYYFSLNGILVAFRGQRSPVEGSVRQAAGGGAAKVASAVPRGSRSPRTPPARDTRRGAGRR